MTAGRFVIDASILAAIALAEERHPRAFAALALLKRCSATAPTLLFFELRNVLLVGERRKRLTEAESGAFLRIVKRLPIDADASCDEAQLLTVARRHRLTIYDAAYLELAVREGLPLATLGADLEKAARAEGVGIVDAD